MVSGGALTALALCLLCLLAVPTAAALSAPRGESSTPLRISIDHLHAPLFRPSVRFSARSAVGGDEVELRIEVACAIEGGGDGDGDGASDRFFCFNCFVRARVRASLDRCIVLFRRCRVSSIWCFRCATVASRPSPRVSGRWVDRGFVPPPLCLFACGSRVNWS
jgi:hypothetical protein